MKDKFPYKFHFYGSDGHYILAVSADTVMYRIFYPNGKYVTGLAIAVIDNKKIHPLNKYEDGLLIDWIVDALTSFFYTISNKP